ncbi:hypothetical protein Q8F55_008965 [Vanrija albida]|uniref:UBA domain-containing protein n=1 Tax=Vanrija albida TaxID=181172 RepID=A0ABR3PSB1_9TREE
MSLERTPSNTTTLYATTSRGSTIVPGDPAAPRRPSADTPKLGKGVTQAKIDELVGAGFAEGQVSSILHASKGDMGKARLVLTHGRDHEGNIDEGCKLCVDKPKKKSLFMAAVEGSVPGSGVF